MRKAKRKILTAGLGIAAYTALEGLACGNPVAPRCPTYGSCGAPEPPYEPMPIDAQPIDAPAADAGVPDAADAPTP